MAKKASPTIELDPQEFLALYWVINECSELHLSSAESIYRAAHEGKPALIEVLEGCSREIAKEKALRRNRKRQESKEETKYLKRMDGRQAKETDSD